jgi:hypothetical protein
MLKNAHFTLTSRNFTIAAPNDAENGSRDGRAPQQCPSRAANGSLGWTNGAMGVGSLW